ncbi:MULTISPECIES: hypothetical protein [unclassified Gordonia (in: high G+C Gram-positive bacteria)]|nr:MULTISPECIES: hypothetical protein [unclassified Gordonia (in: high G+C Gram-positive bacteria)]MCX2753632.1 hypothetical protein [Gordonia sp. 4N]
MAVSERDSIRYHVIDDSTRGSLLSGVHTEAGGREWWRPTV